MKICMIGCGNHANAVYAPSLIRIKKENPAFEFSACCDMDAKKCGDFKELIGFEKSYADYVEMLAKEKPDAVVLVVQYTIAAELGIDIIRRGFPVLMEKPIGGGLEECLSVLKAVEETGVPAQAAFNRRHIPLVREIVSELKKSSEVINHIDYKMFRVDRREDSFYSTAVHGIDLVGYIAGSEYKDVRFDYSGLNILMQCRFNNEITAQLSFIPASGLLNERLEIICDNITYYVRLPIGRGPDFPGNIIKFEGGSLVYDKSGADISDGDKINEAYGFYAQLMDFFTTIQNGGAIKHDIKSAVDTMRIMDCVKRKDLII